MGNINSIQAHTSLDNGIEFGLNSLRERRANIKNAFTLHLAGEGEQVEIVALTGGRGFLDRLAGMGLGLGARMEILQNDMSGKILLGHEGRRLFLGGGMAQKVQVIIIKGGIK